MHTPIPQKIYTTSKKGSELLMKLNNTFQDLHLLSILHRTTQIPRPVVKRRRDAYYSGKKRKETYYKDTQIIVNNRGIIIHKTDLKKGARHDYDIYKKNHPVTPKEVVIMYLIFWIFGSRKGLSRATFITTLQK